MSAIWLCLHPLVSCRNVGFGPIPWEIISIPSPRLSPSSDLALRSCWGGFIAGMYLGSHWGLGGKLPHFSSVFPWMLIYWNSSPDGCIFLSSLQTGQYFLGNGVMIHFREDILGNSTFFSFSHRECNKKLKIGNSNL